MFIETVFWFTLGIVTLCWFIVLARRDFLNWLTFIMLGINLPLVLFLQGWSDWIYTPMSSNFFLIFVMLNLMLIVTFFIEHVLARETYRLDLSPFVLEERSGRIPVGVLNLVVAAAYIAENRIYTGEWFPAMHGIQDHVFHVSGLLYVTNSQYFLLVANTLFYFVRRKPRYLAYTAALVLMPMVTRASRMDAAIEVVGLATFVGYFLLCKRTVVRTHTLRRTATTAVAAVAATWLISFMVNTGTTRMNHFGRYDFLYSDYIGYTGPQIFGEAGAWYYGYFPMSFNNLNYNISLNPDPAGYWYGLNSFRTLWYGVFHFSWFGIPTDIANSNKSVLNDASAVATGFWDFWFDYGVFCFIPIVISAGIYLTAKKTLTRPTKSVAAGAVFFYWVSLWAFMSFQNTVYFDMVFSNMLLTYLTLWYYFSWPASPRARASTRHNFSRESYGYLNSRGVNG